MIEEPPVFALPSPWAFHDPKGPAGLRPWKIGIKRVEIAAGGPFLVAAPEGVPLSAGGRRRGVQAEGQPFNLLEGLYRLSVVSVGTRPDERRLVLSRAGLPIGEIEFRGHVPRPGWSAGRSGTAPISLRAEALDRFIELAIERIRAGETPGPGQAVWDCIVEAWVADQSVVREPPMALIVRHAEYMRSIIADIAAHPRRLLQRRQEMIRIDRVQQLDASCIRWLSRQPGRNVFEQAGPRQRLLAIARHETVDTLENRVLHDFVVRSRDVARRYLDHHLNLSASLRWKIVASYATECSRIARELEALEISRATPPVVPNYALLQERRYRKLWHAYRELLKNLDERDESWRWQHRLWADFSRLAAHVALRQAPEARTIAESPLRISPEQIRGRWSIVGQQSGVFLLTARNRTFVVSTLADLSIAHAKIRPWMLSLGAAAALHIQALDNGHDAVVFVWPMHSAGELVPSFTELAQSASRALADSLSIVERQYGETVAAGGLVFASIVENVADELHGPPSVREADVCVIGLSPESPLLTIGLRRIADAITALANDLTS
jgi:hypothetical protein